MKMCPKKLQNINQTRYAVRLKLSSCDILSPTQSDRRHKKSTKQTVKTELFLVTKKTLSECALASKSPYYKLRECWHKIPNIR